MSREIKFRAWNLDYKWMVFDFHIDSKGVTFDEPSRYFDTPNIEIEENPNLILMQFTGLKDKNGVEIYEGDIVRSLGESDYRFGVRHVEFINGKFTVKGYGLISGLVKVIGNIYENPELLEANNATN